MDESTKKVIEFSVVQVTEATSRQTQWSMKDAKEHQILLLRTDRHTTITAKMKSVYPNIKHQYVWHLSKWVTKKLFKKAQKKSFDYLKSKAISNNLWWCAATCGAPQFIDQIMLYLSIQ
ncbi:Hypothetical predicted protein [Paramuricea clavata]|uniref:Uncharacterized protein n=1 Tax=Paramuricea clavata TaxID=317549 RepID=A0A7D9ILM3_PARCT|nr:Hypothetical predicted protein [Paramuricea clavata]